MRGSNTRRAEAKFEDMRATGWGFQPPYGRILPAFVSCTAAGFAEQYRRRLGDGWRIEVAAPAVVPLFDWRRLAPMPPLDPDIAAMIG